MDALRNLLIAPNNFEPMKYCTEFLEKKEILTLTSLQTALDDLGNTLESEKNDTYGNLQLIQSELKELGTQESVLKLKDTQSRAQKELDTSHLIIKKVYEELGDVSSSLGALDTHKYNARYFSKALVQLINLNKYCIS